MAKTSISTYFFSQFTGAPPTPAGPHGYCCTVHFLVKFCHKEVCTQLWFHLPVCNSGRIHNEMRYT